MSELNSATRYLEQRATWILAASTFLSGAVTSTSTAVLDISSLTSFVFSAILALMACLVFTPRDRTSLICSEWDELHTHYISKEASESYNQFLADLLYVLKNDRDTNTDKSNIVTWMPWIFFAQLVALVLFVLWDLTCLAIAQLFV